MHRIRQKVVPNQPLEDSYQEQQLRLDEKVIIPHDDRYTITRETHFGDQLEMIGNEHIPEWRTANTSNDEPSDADESEVGYISTRDGRNDINDAAQSRCER